MSQNPSNDVSGEQYFAREEITQLGLDLQIDRVGQNFPQIMNSEQCSLLDALKRSDPNPLIKIDLAQILYPKVFTSDAVEYWVDPYGKRHSRTKIERDYYVGKVAQELRAINERIYRALASLAPEEEIQYLQQVRVAIQVGSDHKGRALYLYHGPDHFQAEEVLEMYQNWSERHQEGQGQNAKLAAKLRAAAQFRQSVETPQMDVDDIPGLIEPEQKKSTLK